MEHTYPDALIIGSDQVASCDGQRFGKPGNHENAVRQLRELSGRTVQFDTGLALIGPHGPDQTRVVPCRVTFRKLDDWLIERYLEKEKPYDCAGAAKAEGLGIALIARIDTEDPDFPDRPAADCAERNARPRRDAGRLILYCIPTPLGGTATRSVARTGNYHHPFIRRFRRGECEERARFPGRARHAGA